MTARLATFALISTAAHAGLLLWTPAQPERLQLAIGGQEAALQVSIAAPQATAAATEIATLERPPEPRPASPTTMTRPGPDRPRPRPMASVAKVERDIPPPDKPALLLSQATASPTSSAPNVREQVSAALHNQLLKRFEYPWLARKRGWQGKVTLSLRIARDGVLSDWKVARTSGYAVLDRSALAAAKTIGRLPDSSALLQGRSLQLIIPVEYQLLDS